MKLSDWVAKEAKRQSEFKTNVLKRLAKQSGVSLLTLQIVERGGNMDSYGKAKQVSEATGGKVSVKDLCEA